MYLMRGLAHVPPELRRCAVTIGNFDGVHLGHRDLMDRLREVAGQLSLPAVAITFEPHPRCLLTPDSPPARIMPMRARIRWMEQAQLDAMLLVPFTPAMAATSPEDFVRRCLVSGQGEDGPAGGLLVRHVVVGHGFRFGARGLGSLATLQQMGAQYRFSAEERPLVMIDGAAVSSTRIREQVAAGRLDEAERLLGHPFEIEGRVRRGQQRGRLLGFPTANLALTYRSALAPEAAEPGACVPDMLHPPTGVYVVEGSPGTGPDGREVWWPGVANIGRNPTFGGESLHLEVHFFEPCGDIYRRWLRVRFRQRLRGEVRFASREQLQQQIAADLQAARNYFSRTGRVPAEYA
jgi:riboflavin kinase/FMN adenylyltransferase